MATRTKQVPETDFIAREDAERMAQEAAGRVMMTYPEPEPEISEPDPDDIALANVLAELGSSSTDAKVNIYQLDARQNRAFIGAFMPSEFSLEKVQAEFGPGDYEIRVYNAGKLATRKVIKIAAPKNPVQSNQLAMTVPQIAPDKIIETMQNGFKEMSAMFANALNTLAANQPKPKTTMEMLQEMQLMREIMGGNQPAIPQTDPLQMVELAVQLSEKITPRTGEPGAGEIILEAMKNFAPVLGKIAQASPPAMPQIMTQQNPALMSNPIQAPAQPPAQNPEHDEMTLAKRMYLNMLLKNAAADNDTETYANLMLDVVGEDAARAFASDPQWFEKLCAEAPQAAQFPEWFGRLRNDVLAMTEPEPEPLLTDGEKPVIDTGTQPPQI